MALPGDQIPPDQNYLMNELRELRRLYAELAAARSAEQTTVKGGTFRVADASGNDIVRIGLVPSIFGGTAPKPGMDLVRPAGNKVLHYESPGFWAMYDTEGRVVVSDDIGSGKGLARPWTPVQLFPQFRSNLAAGATGYTSVNVGVLASWEGRVSVDHPRIEVDGIWGQASGTNTATYQLLLGGVVVGTWNTGNALAVSRKGPYDISSYVGQDWLKVEVKISTSAGTGETAIQLLGCYLRQT